MHRVIAACRWFHCRSDESPPHNLIPCFFELLTVSAEVEAHRADESWSYDLPEPASFHSLGEAPDPRLRRNLPADGRVESRVPLCSRVDPRIFRAHPKAPGYA